MKRYHWAFLLALAAACIVFAARLEDGTVEACGSALLMFLVVALLALAALPKKKDTDA